MPFAAAAADLTIGSRQIRSAQTPIMMPVAAEQGIMMILSLLPPRLPGRRPSDPAAGARLDSAAELGSET